MIKLRIVRNLKFYYFVIGTIIPAYMLYNLYHFFQMNHKRIFTNIFHCHKKGGTIHNLSGIWLPPSDLHKTSTNSPRLISVNFICLFFCANDLAVFDSKEQEQKLKIYV